MALRGTPLMQVSSASSYIQPWPTGASVGDLALLFAAHGYNLGVPVGWTTLFLDNGHTWNSFLASKVLTSGDITAGSVTVGAAGTYDGVVEIVTMVGAPTIREWDTTPFSATSPSLVSTSGAAGGTGTDGAIYFGSFRSDNSGGVSDLVTISRGTQEAQAQDTNAGGAIYAETIPGPLIVGFCTAGDVAGGCKNAIVVLELAGFSAVPLTISCVTSAAAPLGVPYSSSFSSTVTTGFGLFNYQITSGSLPPGLSLNSATGAVTGTPTTLGIYVFTVTCFYGEQYGYPTRQLPFSVSAGCAIGVCPNPGGSYAYIG